MLTNTLIFPIMENLSIMIPNERDMFLMSNFDSIKDRRYIDKAMWSSSLLDHPRINKFFFFLIHKTQDNSLAAILVYSFITIFVQLSSEYRRQWRGHCMLEIGKICFCLLPKKKKQNEEWRKRAIGSWSKGSSKKEGKYTRL